VEKIRRLIKPEDCSEHMYIKQILSVKHRTKEQLSLSKEKPFLSYHFSPNEIIRSNSLPFDNKHILTAF